MNFCDICKKKYSSYNSYSNHIRRFHKNNKNITENITENTTENNDEINHIICDYCNKKFASKYNLKIHLNRCNIKKFEDEQNNDEITDIKNKYVDINNKYNDVILKINDMNREINILKSKEEKYLEQIAKLKNKNIYNTKNINNIINNINNNNVNIISLGKEYPIETLSYSDKKEIMRAKYFCLDKIVDIIHCSRYKQYKNIIIANLNNDFAYKYDEIEKKFKCVMKDELLSDLIDERFQDIKDIYEEFNTTNKLDEHTKKIIEDFIDSMDKDEKFKYDTKVYKNYREYKKQAIKVLIYDNFDKIIKDLTVLSLE